METRDTEGKEYVLKMAKEHDVKFIWMWFTDILGMLKSFAITVEELEGALNEGMGFDGSSIEGFARIDESDMVALPEDPPPCAQEPRPGTGAEQEREWTDSRTAFTHFRHAFRRRSF